jgi:ankyrin repeat protein
LGYSHCSDNKDGRTPFWWAAGNGHSDVVKRLLERESVNINFKDKDGRTPLSWAAQNGYSDVVELLLENEDIDIDSKDKDRRTPLW